MREWCSGNAPPQNPAKGTRDWGTRQSSHGRTITTHVAAANRYPLGAFYDPLDGIALQLEKFNMVFSSVTFGSIENHTHTVRFKSASSRPTDIIKFHIWYFVHGQKSTAYTTILATTVTMFFDLCEWLLSKQYFTKNYQMNNFRLAIIT